MVSHHRRRLRHAGVAIVICCLIACCEKAASPDSFASPPLIPAGEADLTLQLAVYLPPAEALAVLLECMERSSEQAGQFADVLRDMLAKQRWTVEQAFLDTGYTIDHLWLRGNSLWVAFSDADLCGAFRWDLDTRRIPAVLFPTKNSRIRSWHFSPDGRRVLMERSDCLVLYDAHSLKPLREIPELPGDRNPAGLVSFTKDSLLFAHATESGTSLAWQIREATHGELLRSETVNDSSRSVLAGSLSRDGLDLLSADGSGAHIPLNPTEAVSSTRPWTNQQVLLAIPRHQGGFLALLRDRTHQESGLGILETCESQREIPTEEAPWNQLQAWTKHPSIWHSPFRHPSLEKPFVEETVTAFHESTTLTVRADVQGRIIVSRKLPLLSATTPPCTIASLAPELLERIGRQLPDDAIDGWKPFLTASGDGAAAVTDMDKVRERISKAGKRETFADIDEVFSHGEEDAILSLIQSSAPSGPRAAACLAASLRSLEPRRISHCLDHYPDIPESLVRLAKSRIAWLEGRQGDAIAQWPDPFPHYERILATQDWENWESQDFRIPYEQMRQTIAEIIAEYRLPEEADQQQRDAVYERLMDPKVLQPLGKERWIPFCLDAAMQFAEIPEEGRRTLELANRAKTLGAPTAPCLRAEALALTALGEHANARTRWINLITYHPLSDHKPSDYSEAAYSAYENGDAQQAMVFLATGTHRFPDDADFALRAAWIALLIGHPESAWRFLTRGQQSGFPAEKIPHSWALFAIASLQSGAPEEAAAYHAELIRSDESWLVPETIEALGWPEEFKQALRDLAEQSPFRQDHLPAPAPTSPGKTR